MPFGKAIRVPSSGCLLPMRQRLWVQSRQAIDSYSSSTLEEQEESGPVVWVLGCFALRTSFQATTEAVSRPWHWPRSRSITSISTSLPIVQAYVRRTSGSVNKSFGQWVNWTKQITIWSTSMFFFLSKVGREFSLSLWLARAEQNKSKEWSLLTQHQWPFRHHPRQQVLHEVGSSLQLLTIRLAFVKRMYPKRRSHALGAFSVYFHGWALDYVMPQPPFRLMTQVLRPYLWKFVSSLDSGALSGWKESHGWLPEMNCALGNLAHSKPCTYSQIERTIL